jgi:hypothetical protein
MHKLPLVTLKLRGGLMQGGEIIEAALTIEPSSGYLRRIVWYSRHRRLRGLQK